MSQNMTRARKVAAASAEPPPIPAETGKRLCSESRAAGIGGGSADAAATLRALVMFWDIEASDSQLFAIASELGADVPVCLFGKPAQISGIGEVIAPAHSLPPCGLLLVNPGAALATPDVFGARQGAFSAPCRLGGYKPAARGFADALRACGNDLEEPACSLVPQIRDVLARIQEAPGCLLSRMSGSGATCFGLFENALDAEAAARHLDAAEPGWWISATTLVDDASTLAPLPRD